MKNTNIRNRKEKVNYAVIIPSSWIRNELKILSSSCFFNKSSFHPVANHPVASKLGVGLLLYNYEYRQEYLLFWQSLEGIVCAWNTSELSQSNFAPA